MSTAKKPDCSAVELDVYHCPYTDTDVDRTGCHAVCTEPDVNRTVCARLVCESPWRLCLACVRHDEVDETSCATHGDHKCAWHVKHGYNARKDPEQHAAYERQREMAQSRLELTANRRASRRDEHPEGDAHGERIEDAQERPRARTKRRKSGSMAGTTESDDEATVHERKMLQGLLRFESEEVLEIPPERIRRYAKQPRHLPDEELVSTIKLVGQLMPGLVVRVTDDPQHDFELDDGERRWRACKRLGIPFRALVVLVHSESHQHALSAVANFGRKAHTDVELALAMGRIMHELHVSIGTVAKMFSMSTSYAYKHLSLLKLDPAAYPLMRATGGKSTGHRLTLRVAAHITNLPQEEHLRVAEHVVARAMREPQAIAYVEQQARKLGVHILRRRPQPSKLHRTLSNLIAHTTAKLENLFSLHERYLHRAFSGKSVHDKHAMLKELDTLIAEFERLRKALRT